MQILINWFNIFMLIMVLWSVWMINIKVLTIIIMRTIHRLKLDFYYWKQFFIISHYYWKIIQFICKLKLKNYSMFSAIKHFKMRLQGQVWVDVQWVEYQFIFSSCSPYLKNLSLWNPLFLFIILNKMSLLFLSRRQIETSQNL